MAETQIARKLASQLNVSKLDPKNPAHVTAFAKYLYDNVATEELNDQNHGTEDINFIANANIGSVNTSEENPYLSRGFFQIIHNVDGQSNVNVLNYRLKALAYLTGYGGAGATTGIGPHIRRKIEGKKKLTRDEIKAFVNSIQWYEYDKEAWSFFLDYVLENQEDDFFRIVDLDEFKFDIWDKKLVENLNAYLDDESLVVTELERAVERGGTVVDAYYVWQSDPTTFQDEDKIIKKDRIDLVDPSLYQDTQANFKRPFRRFGRKGGKNEGAGTNNVKFAEGSGFSQFKLINTETIGNWWTTEVPKSYEYYKTNVIPSLMQFFGFTDNKASWDINKARENLDYHIENFLEHSTEKFNYPVNWAGDETKYLPRREYIAKRLLDVFRKAAFYAYAKELHDKTEEELANLDQSKLNNKVFAIAEAAAGASEVVTGVPPERDKPLSDKELEERQRFMKQCALMTRLGDLAIEHEKKGKERYNQRFYMVKDGNGDQHGTISKLLLPKASEISEFLEIKPSVHAFLVPKLIFYKVFNGKNGLIEEEFQFRNFTSTNRVESMLNSKFDRGGDYGIKDFSFTFEGSTPATARNDITANLSLYFQTFDDFITVQPENKSSFVDMLLLPGNSNKADDTRHTTLQHNSEYYRIRVDVGWNLRSTEAIKNLSNVDVDSLKTAIEKVNKSFYLTMIDHTIDFRDDGSVGIDVQYRAYMETALKSSGLDALADHRTKKVLKKVSDDYKKIVESGNCSVAEENTIRRSLLEVEDVLRRQSFQSIMKRLLDNDFIYFKKIAAVTGNNFQKTGFFTNKVKFAGGGMSSAPSKSKDKSEKAKKKDSETTLDYGVDFFSENLSNDEDYNYINYFFLGDLLYVILDSLYQEDNPKKYIDGFEKFKFILGSFEFEDLLDDSSVRKTINLGSIPVSVEVFFEWFAENIIKPERKNYSVMYFIRDLCTYLIGEILTENCFKSSYDKKLHFKTTNFIGHKDPFADMNGNIIDISKYYGKKGATSLPLQQDSVKHFPIQEMTNYIMIYVDTPRITKSGDIRTGNKKIDGDNGIYHFQIGKDRGLLKKMKFSKSDMKYVREARFFRHGFDGLMQLSNVYNVSLEMIGNTMYYPGMEVYINPLGFLGAKSRDWDPTRGAPSGSPSIANKLGFGGYHLVTRVKSSIGPGKFTTTVDAMFNYSGDGDPNSYLTGPKKKEEKKIDEIDPKTFKKDTKCTAVYNQIVNQKFDLLEGQSTWDPIDFSPGSTTPDESTPAEPATESTVSSPEEQSTVETAKELLNPNSNSNTGIVPTSLLKTYSPNSTSSSQATSAYDKTDPSGKRYTVLAGTRFYENNTTEDDQQATAREALFRGSTP